MTDKITALDNHQLLSAFIDHYTRVYHDLVFKGVPAEDAKGIAKKDFLKHMETLIPLPSPHLPKECRSIYLIKYADIYEQGGSAVYAHTYATSMEEGNSEYYSHQLAKIADKGRIL